MGKTVNTITIVIPVYGDWPSLKDCINSLIKYVDLNKHSIVFVNDEGPEADLLEKNIKELTRGHKNIHYYRNDQNLGFVQTCNRAVLKLDKTNNDILLLNSDTKVTSGFLNELTSVLYSEPTIATVTPRSNNATLATVPLSAASQKGIEQDQSYEIWQTINKDLPRYVVVPTGHGFCMLIKRELIKKYGLFDSVFGKGYGEEVDLCQRFTRAGYKNVLANHAYVFHLEAKSFSLEIKNELLATNNKVIWNRYPNYRQAVRDYMAKAVDEENKILNHHGLTTDNKSTSLINRLIQKIRRTTS